MRKFYEEIAHGMPTDAALAAAKRNYIFNSDNLKAHPFFWASIILTTKSKPMDQSNTWKYWFVLSAAVFILVWGWYIFRKSRKIKV